MTLGLRAIALLAWLVVSQASAQTPPVKKFLLIGIDGCRTDALLEAKAPNLHALLRDGAFSERNDVLGKRGIGADTVSGQGWTSLLTGVWADKHGQKNNLVDKQVLFPTFFARFRTANRKATTAALVSWKAMKEYIFTPGDGARLVADSNAVGAIQADRDVAAAAEKLLTEEDPSAVYLLFAQVDSAGHKHGFSPKVAEYVGAIASVDKHIGGIVKALAKRENFANEDWLIVVAADHGGRGLGHIGGRSYEEVRHTFLILHGPSVKPGKINEKTENVDVAVTALTHLGVVILPEWKLDGKVVGLKAK